MPPEPVPDATGEPFGLSNDATYDSGMSALGYLFVTISSRQLKIEFWPLDEENSFDTWIVDLQTRLVNRA